MRYVLVTDDRAQGNDWRQLPDGDQWQWSRVMWGAGALMRVSLIADHTLTLLHSYTLTHLHSYTLTLLHSYTLNLKTTIKEVLLFGTIKSYNVMQ